MLDSDEQDAGQGLRKDLVRIGTLRRGDPSAAGRADRRASFRVGLALDVRMGLDGLRPDGRAVGRVCEVGPGGLSARIDRAPDAGGWARVELVPAQHRSVLRVEGCVVWVRAEPGGGARVGIRLVGHDAAAWLAAILRVVDGARVDSDP